MYLRVAFDQRAQPSHGLAAAADEDLGVEAFSALDEFGGGAGVQALAVHNLEGSGDRALDGGRDIRAIIAIAIVHHFPLRIRLATEIYFRPAS